MKSVDDFENGNDRGDGLSKKGTYRRTEGGSTTEGQVRNLE